MNNCPNCGMPMMMQGLAGARCPHCGYEEDAPPPNVDAFERGMPIRYHNPKGTEFEDTGEYYPDELHGKEGYYLHADPNYPGSGYMMVPGMSFNPWIMHKYLMHRDADEDPTWKDFWHGSSVENTEYELHIALDVPERIRERLGIHAARLGLPLGSLENPANYHITVAYADSGLEKIKPHEIRNNFNMTGLKFEPVGIRRFENDAIVLELENEYFTRWADLLNDWLEDRGVKVNRYPGGWKPHITIAYTSQEPKGHTLPPLTFRCGPISISTPRSAPQDPLGPLTAAYDPHALRREAEALSQPLNHPFILPGDGRDPWVGGFNDLHNNYEATGELLRPPDYYHGKVFGQGHIMWYHQPPEDMKQRTHDYLRNHFQRPLEERVLVRRQAPVTASFRPKICKYCQGTLDVKGICTQCGKTQDAHEASHGWQRGVITPDNDVHIWDEDHGTHGQLIDYLSQENGHSPWDRNWVRFMVDRNNTIGPNYLSEEEAAIINEKYPHVTVMNPRTAQNAVGKTFYHVAPASARESIMQHGLDPTRGSSPWPDLNANRPGFPVGNYMWDNPESAKGYLASQAMSALRRPGGDRYNPKHMSTEDFMDYGIHADNDGNVYVHPSYTDEDDPEPEDYDSDEYREWEERQDERDYRDYTPEDKNLLPPHLQGHDIWEVRPSHEHELRLDEEPLWMQEGHDPPSYYRDESKITPHDWQPDEEWEANDGDFVAQRYYTSQPIAPQHISLHQHVPLAAVAPALQHEGPWSADELAGGESYHTIPEPFTRLPSYEDLQRQRGIWQGTP